MASSSELDDLRRALEQARAEKDALIEQHAHEIDKLCTKHAADLERAHDAVKSERRRSAALCTPSGEAASQASSSGETPSLLKEAGQTPSAETPTWLREADQHASDGATVASAASAELACTRKLLHAAESKAMDALQHAAELQEERDRLAAEKAELVAEIANMSGHVNHKQKIHYVAKLKKEVDELKVALKEAQQAKNATRARADAGKENGAPARAQQPHTQTRAARNATAAV